MTSPVRARRSPGWRRCASRVSRWWAMKAEGSSSAPSSAGSRSRSPVGARPPCLCAYGRRGCGLCRDAERAGAGGGTGRAPDRAVLRGGSTGRTDRDAARADCARRSYGRGRVSRSGWQARPTAYVRRVRAWCCSGEKPSTAHGDFRGALPLLECVTGRTGSPVGARRHWSDEKRTAPAGMRAPHHTRIAVAQFVVRRPPPRRRRSPHRAGACARRSGRRRRSASPVIIRARFDDRAVQHRGAVDARAGADPRARRRPPCRRSAWRRGPPRPCPGPAGRRSGPGTAGDGARPRTRSAEPRTNACGVPRSSQYVESTMPWRCAPVGEQTGEGLALDRDRAARRDGVDDGAVGRRTHPR